MKVWIVSIVVILMTAMAFQNCGRIATPPETVTTTAVNPKLETINAPQIFVDLSQVRAAGSGDPLQNITISLQNGTIVGDHLNGNAETKKLRKADLDDLKSIFSSYTLCAPPQRPADQMCTMDYVAPYAVLIDPATQRDIKLGDNQSVCHAQDADFCDSTKKQLLLQRLFILENDFPAL